MFIGLTESWEVDKQNKKKRQQCSKKISNFLLEPSWSKIDRKKAIHENVKF